MAATEYLRVIMELQTGQYKREAREAAKATKEVGDATKQTTKSTDESTAAVGRSAKSFRDLSTTTKFAIAGVATAAVVGFAKDSIRAASDAEESINAVEKTFGAAADRVLAFSEVASQAAGLSKAEFNSLATVTGSLLTNMGFAFDDAAQESIKLTTRAADMASVFNTDVDDALTAINAGLRGETEPLRRFGISLSDAEVRAKAVELGLADTTAEVDKHGKAVAALELIYEQSAKTQGDFIQTSDSLANQQRVAAAEFENLKATFGATFTPFAAGLLAGPIDFVQEIQAAFGNDAPLRMREATERLFDSLRAGEPHADALAEALGHIADKSDLTTDQVRTLASALGLTDDDVTDLADDILVAAEAAGLGEDALADLEDALSGVAPKAEEVGGGMQRLGGEMNQIPKGVLKGIGSDAETATPSVQDMAAAVRDVHTALLEATDPLFASVAAKGRFDDAKTELDELKKSGEATKEELAEAELNVAETGAAFGAAQAALRDSGLEKAVEGVATVLEESYGHAQDLLNAVGILDDQDIVVPFRFQISPADRALLNTAQTFRPRPLTSPGAFGGGRQHGGPIEALRPYVVGEAGPELIVPQQSGFVVNNNDFQKMLAALQSGGRGDINLTFQGSDVNTDIGTAAAIAGIVRRVEVRR